MSRAAVASSKQEKSPDAFTARAVAGRAVAAPSWRIMTPLSLALAAVIVLAFWRLVYCGFVTYDDPLYVTSNDQLRMGLSRGGIAWAFGGVNTANWHPLTTLSYLFDYQFFKLNPLAYHVHNLVYHVLATVLLFIALSRMSGAVWRSFVVAALFGWHPLHVQSVAWVSERKDVLSGVFCMLTLLAYLQYVRRPGALRYALLLLAFAGGLMSKPMLVTLPPALLLLDIWPLGRLRVGSWRAPMLGPLTAELPTVPLIRLILEKLPLLLMAIISSVITFQIQKNVGATANLYRVPIDLRLANAVVAYMSYLWKMLWPHALSVFYPLSGELGIWSVAAVMMLFITVVVLWRGWRWPFLFTGWFWYVGTLVPVIGLVQVGDQAMADRYTYLPLIGAFIMIVWGAAELFAHAGGGRLLLPIATALVLGALALRTWQEVGYWEGTEALFLRAASVVPHNARAHLAVGSFALKKGDIPTALEHLRLSVKYDANFPEAQNRFGVALVAAQQYPEAADAFAKAARQLENESSEQELKRDKIYHEAQYNYGLVCVQLGRLDDAMAGFRRRLWATPDEKKALAGVAEVSLKQGKLDDAVEYARRSLAQDPAFPPAHYQLGLALMKQRKFNEAAGEFQAILRDTPGDLESRFQLAEILPRLGRTPEAIAYLNEVLAVRPDDARSHLKLGALLQSQGQIEPAIEHYRQALKIDPNSGAANNLAWLMATSPDARFRDGAAAIGLVERVRARAGGDHPELLDTLAAAYAENGQFDQAVRTAEAAIELAHKGNQPALEQEIAVRLALYRLGKPYRESAPPAATQRAGAASGRGD